ncbi:hypothetical protein SNEBB_002808 [Seison nebaliae]|nr:hypothetical protein SNEBB_002808 [Seison nebaliae]
MTESESGHTIVLLQNDEAMSSRTYLDFNSQRECFEGLCKMFEETLKIQLPDSRSITYNIAELFDFLDHFYDVGCLTLSKGTTYQPKNRSWLKEKIYLMLRQQLSKEEETK